MSHPQPTVKTFREKAMEVTKPYAEVGDLTSAYAVYMKMKADEEAEGEPIRIGRHRPTWAQRRYRW
jgi:hypothetical protein